MSCCDQAGLLPYDQAINELLSVAKPITESEMVPVAEAQGRVLTEDVVSSLDVPPADNSAMDGYALRYSDFAKAGLTTRGRVVLPISQRIPAGAVPEALSPCSAARIFTGSEIPEGADTVIMQEHCRALSGTDDDAIEGGQAVELPVDIHPGDNIRRKGLDITADSVILNRGHKLLPQDLGLLASIGLAEVKVYRRLKLAILSTGDEIVEPGQVCPAGHIYNSNRYTLAGLIDAMGMERVDMGIVPDDSAVTEAVLRKAAELADCIITTGGVSVGEEDHVKSCVEKLGELQLWRLAIKPGKPLAFGHVLDKPFFGLPGNPAAVFVTFAMVARPYLLRFQGCEDGLLPMALTVQANFSRTRPVKRQEYLRARLDVSEQGVMSASLHTNQSSGALSAASWSNGFAVLPIDQLIANGDSVKFIPYSELFA
jgi:molybdopterin molybdotransferase